MPKANESNNRVLVIDDEKGICQVLQAVLSGEGYDVDTCTSGREGVERFKERNHQVVITDILMEGMDGLQVLKAVKALSPRALVIVITAFDNWSNAVEAMRHGAFDYIKKPFDNEDIKIVVAKAMHQARALTDLAAEDSPLFRNLVGNSAAIQKVRRMISRVAATDSTVLVQGESGTGKELVARAIHAASLRAAQPLFAANCGAFAENLLESELFGHVKGAFTGAVVDKRGLFQAADGATFLLDEITELSPAMQVKLLRVLEEREIRPVGSTVSIRVDVRIIAATNRNAEQEVEEGKFREDLFYRLNVISIHLPPLRERPEDIPLIAGNLLARFALELKKPNMRLHDDAMKVLRSYDWPGNVRQLGNMLQRAMLMCEGDEIKREHLVARLRTSSPADRIPSRDIPPDGINLEKHLEEIEKKFIRAALDKTRGNITQAAQLLRTSFRSLRYRIKKLDLKNL